MSLKEIIENTPQFSLYNQIVKELNGYRDENPMSDAKGNNFRHIGGSMGVAQQEGIIPTNIMGLGKEYNDYFNLHKDGRDSIHDLGNNLFGSILGQKLKFVPRKYMYKLIDKVILR